MKKILKLLLFVFCLAQGYLYAQAPVPWYTMLAIRIGSFFSKKDQENLNFIRNLPIVQTAITEKLKQVGNSFANYDAYIEIVTQILDILYDNSPQLQKGRTVSEREKEMAELESHLNLLPNHPISNNVGAWIKAWEKNTKDMSYYINITMHHYLVTALKELSIAKRNKVVSEINGIQVKVLKQPSPVELRFNALRDASIKKLGLSLSDISKFVLLKGEAERNKKYVSNAIAIIGLLHDHLSPEMRAKLSQMTYQLPQSSSIEKYISEFIKNPTASHVSQEMIKAWQKEPIVVIRLLSKMLGLYMEELAVQADEKTIDTVIQEIKNI